MITPNSTRTALLSFAAALFTLTFLQADTITLKDGEKIQGTIIEESEQSVRIEIQVSASIRDERVVPRDQITQIEKTADDQKAFAALEPLFPLKNSLTEKGYDTLMRTKLQAFLDQYPKSTKRAKVSAWLNQMKKEKARVKSGFIKLDGQWISPKELNANPYPYRSQQILLRMQSLAQANDYLGAMRAFDQLETKYPGSLAYVEAIPLATETLVRFARVTKGLLETQSAQAAKREESIKLSSAQEQERIKAAIAEEHRRYQQALDQAEERGIKWKRVYQDYKPSLDATAQLIAGEYERLSGLDLTAIEQSNRALAKANTAVQEGDITAAEEAAAEGKKQWSNNPYLTEIDAQIAELKKVPETVEQEENTTEKIYATLEGAGQTVGTDIEAQPEREQLMNFRNSLVDSQRNGASPASPGAPAAQNTPDSPAPSPAPSAKASGGGFSPTKIGLLFGLVMGIIIVAVKVLGLDKKKIGGE